MTKTRLFHWNCIVLGIAIVLLGSVIWYTLSLNRPNLATVMGNRVRSNRRVIDEAGVLSEYDRSKFEWNMDMIMQESDVDIRFVFLYGTGDKTIEELAVYWMEKLRIGGKTRQERGLLLLYDTKDERLKVEVGYGLEEYFPDAFIGYLVNRHAKLYFESGDKSLGLRWLLRLLQARIRDAVLGQTFDPRILDKLPVNGGLSGGAGASTTLQMDKSRQNSQLSEVERRIYVPQNKPLEAYHLYLKWLSQPIYDPEIELFTESTRSYLSRLMISPAYLDFIFLGEYGKSYEIVERGDLAILYFTGTPFASPHFFVREEGKWRIDLMTEVRNTKEIVGGVYTWTYVGRDDLYTQAFADLLTNIKGYIRFKNGDNRELMIRGVQ